MKKELTINKKYILLIIMIYMLVFQKIIQDIFPFFTYLDELLALLSLFIIVFNKFSKIKKEHKKIILVLSILIIIGLISNFLFGYQEAKAVIIDIFLFLKFYLVLFATISIYNYNFFEKYEKKINFHLNLIVLIFFIATLLNYIFKYNPSTYRFGIMTNQIFYSHPTYLAAAIIFILSFKIIINKKIFDAPNLVLLVILLSTMRFKAFAAVIGVLLVALYIKKFNKKLSGKVFLFLALIAIVICSNQFKYYFVNNDYARNGLLTKSFEIATDHFPLGTGFGTYGSYISGKYYSPLYHRYNLNNYYGLSQYNYSYVSDSFWPMIIGEFGFLGLILYIVLCIMLLQIIQKEYNDKNKYLYIGKLIAFIYLIISSTSESAFVNPLAISLAFLLGITADDEINQTKIQNKNISFSKVLIKFLTLNIIKINDYTYTKIIYYLTFHKKIDLKNPKTFNEKMQWLKLHDHQEVYTTMVDKYEAKKYVESVLSDKFIIPTIGIYNSFDEIDFDTLPNEFVIKCTHDSGGLIICKDKNSFDLKSARKKITKSLKTNYYTKWREWPYKNIKPRIIIEKYMGDNLLDYKIQCCNGKVDNILVCEGRNTPRGVRYLYFDKDWNYLNYCNYGDINTIDLTSLKPSNLDEMINIAEKLSVGFAAMRIDLYNINKKIFFGEITLYSNAGFDDTITREADKEMGDRLTINIQEAL